MTHHIDVMKASALKNTFQIYVFVAVFGIMVSAPFEAKVAKAA